ncbi:hypothetical protein [Gloeobacter kilaueensis]|uniref:Uncharacterized protein n=1 Tax=Gloeobacter kilaueensis (strain ATCC BAA-2537 / CCAP 1431/1 / ULC 316 / JS1) TaxID=1183438 RepID=U5QJ13_GLOK1|nr:hypothetical protein [Gloeobacter kilaueensis]AGY57619.1 hypothetical protein GKIL_1373 [Gloeobacter kilaueensis JS1]
MESLDRVAPTPDLTRPLTGDTADEQPLREQISAAERRRCQLELGVLLLIGLIGWLTLAGLMMPMARQLSYGLG